MTTPSTASRWDLPSIFDNLSVLPLIGGAGAPGGEPWYDTLDSALGAGSLRVTETSDAGSVPEIKVLNRGGRPVLIIDGDELVGLLRAAMAHTDGPFSTRYPRDKAPAEPSDPASVPAVPYGTWEQLREASGDVAILAVGTMVQPATQAAELLAADGVDCAVVNCRFLKPLDSALLESLVQRHRILVTVEEGTIVNGFGAYLAETLQTTHPEVRVVALGVPDRLVEQAPRAEQLELFGLTAAGIARRITALQHEESLEAR